MYIISPWIIGHVNHRLKSLTNLGFAVSSDQTFVKETLVSYLLFFWLKSKLQFCNNISCKVNVYFRLFRVQIRVWFQFSPRYFGKFCSFWCLLGAFYLFVKNLSCSLWIQILVNLGIYFWVWPDFCDRNCVKLLVTLLG